MSCMEPLRAGQTCPACGGRAGERNAAHQLPCGTVLAQRYLVGRVIGQGGFGITYIGRDLTLNMRVAVKEYYPTRYVNRAPQSAGDVVTADERDAAYLRENKSRFLSEARVLAKFHGSAGVVDVRDFFEERGTAYIIMEYLDGEDLRTHLTRELLTADQAFSLMRPVMDALEKIHDAHVVHRDISPDNIMLLKDGSLCLMDFGAAKMIDYTDQHTVSVVLKTGYAPEEQYRSRGEQGPWTDIYALCATIYKSITGVTPDDSLQRMHEDELVWPSQMGVAISSAQERVLKRGMSVLAADRFRSIGEMRAALEEPGEPSEPHAESALSMQPAPVPASVDDDVATGDWLLEAVPAGNQARSGRRAGVVAAALGAAAALVAALAGFAFGMFDAPEPARYEVAFDTQGGSAVAARVLEEGALLDEPPVPSKPDCSFAGWYYDSACTLPVAFPATVQADTRLFAAWDPVLVSYTVRYLEKGTKTSLKAKKTVKDKPAGSTVSAKAPSIEGYTLASKGTKRLKLSVDAADNTITFYYTRRDTGSSDAGAGASEPPSGSGSPASDANLPYVDSWDDYI